MIKIISLMLLVGSLGCRDEDASNRALKSMGFTDIQLGDYAWFQCDEHDDYRTSFTATNPQGQRVEGAVCCGIMKNCTVRFK